jgi:hypothetical protein
MNRLLITIEASRDLSVLTAEGAEGTEKEKREKWCCSQIT